MRTQFKNSRRLWALVILAALASGGCCCFQRKGLVLRGDWSLELNRVPHMTSNGPTYGGDCCSTGCVTTCTATSGSGCHCSACMNGYGGGGYDPAGGGAGYGQGGEGMPVPPEPSPAAQSRFHPVPTRPVFEPQGAAYGPELAGPPIPQASQLPPPSSTSRRRPTSTDTTVRHSPAAPGSVSQPPENVAASEVDGDVRRLSYEETLRQAPADTNDGATPEFASSSASPRQQKNVVQWRTATHRRS